MQIINTMKNLQKGKAVLSRTILLITNYFSWAWS